MLFRDAQGDFALREMDGFSIVGGGTIGNPGSGWRFQGIADLNGDGRADILFKSTSSNLMATWELNDTRIIGGATIGDPGAAWRIAGVA